MFNNVWANIIFFVNLKYNLIDIRTFSVNFLLMKFDQPLAATLSGDVTKSPQTSRAQGDLASGSPRKRKKGKALEAWHL